MLTLTIIQGHSKRSGWSGHGRTNNRAGNFDFRIFFEYAFAINDFEAVSVHPVTDENEAIVIVN